MLLALRVGDKGISGAATRECKWVSGWVGSAEADRGEETQSMKKGLEKISASSLEKS